MADSDPNNKIKRRDFFRKGLLELFKPIDRTMARIHEAAGQFKALEKPPQPTNYATPGSGDGYSTEVPVFLKPPGAIGREFYTKCSKSRDCMAACPAQAIRMDPDIMGGTPYIDVDRQPCLMCPDVPCSTVCKSGALLPVVMDMIRIGIARWNAVDCKRTNGEDCRLCFESCPIKTRAIEISEQKVVIHENACTGCGLCRRICPTSPRAIVIDPIPDH